MSKLSAAFTVAFWLIVAAGVTYSFFFAGSRDRGNGPVELRNYRMVEDFSLVDQRGNTVSRADLEGKVWVVNFIFTSCTTQCLVLSQRMKDLQTQFAANPAVAFVSLSVDPQTDTPQRLAKYAERYGAGPNWHLLTGETRAVDRLIKESFLLPVARSDAERSQVYLANLIHSERFAVVDRLGVVRYYADGMAPGAVESVSQAVTLLLAANPEPP